MKKIVLYIAAVITIGAGCRKTYDDTIKGETVDQRLATALAAYQKKLTGSTFGWIFTETTTGTAYNQGVSQAGPKAIFSYYMQFIDSNNVTMFSDFDASTSGVGKTSGYRVKALTRPALIFDTYSYLHIPCEPNPAVSKSPYGAGYGWGTDFEFSFADTAVPTDAGDTIRLIGNLNSASGILVKATQQQRDAYYSGSLLGQVTGLFNFLEYFKRLSFGGSIYEMRPNSDRTITFTWQNGSGQNVSQTVSYYTTPSGIVLATPIVNGSTTINSVDNLVWNQGTQTLSVSVNGQPGTVKSATQPVKIDNGSPLAWYNAIADRQHIWASTMGFHSNGVDDAFGIRSLRTDSGYFYLYAYVHNLFVADQVDGFFTAMVGDNTLKRDGYVFAPTPNFNQTGKVVFTPFGFVGTSPAPSVTNSVNLLTNPAGYYLIQTGAETYDMVLASDAKSWISWSLF